MDVWNEGSGMMRTVITERLLSQIGSDFLSLPTSLLQFPKSGALLCRRDGSEGRPPEKKDPAPTKRTFGEILLIVKVSIKAILTDVS